MGGSGKILLANEGDVLVDVSVDGGFQFRVLFARVLQESEIFMGGLKEDLHRPPSADVALCASLRRLR
jgi:hypothetical protein